MDRKYDEGTINGKFRIQKADEEQHIVFGWAYVSNRTDGSRVQDWSGDIVDIREIERAAYNYVEFYRDGSEMHERGGIGTLVESIVFTPEKIAAIGIPEGSVPNGWWIGIRISDSGVWDKVKDGTYRMFSIEGEARSEPVQDNLI